MGPPIPGEGLITFVTLPQFIEGPTTPPLTPSAAAAAATTTAATTTDKASESSVSAGASCPDIAQRQQQQQQQQQQKALIAAAWSAWQETHQQHKEIWGLLSPCSRCFAERHRAGRGAPGGAPKGPLETAFFCRLVYMHVGAPDCHCWGAPEALRAAAAATKSLLLLQQDVAWCTDTPWQRLQHGGPPSLSPKAVRGPPMGLHSQDNADRGPQKDGGPSGSMPVGGPHSKGTPERPPGVTVRELPRALAAALGLVRSPLQEQQQQQQQQRIEQQQQQQQIQRVGRLLRWSLSMLQRLHQEETALKRLCCLVLSLGAPEGPSEGAQMPAPSGDTGLLLQGLPGYTPAAALSAAAAAGAPPPLLLPAEGAPLSTEEESRVGSIWSLRGAPVEGPLVPGDGEEYYIGRPPNIGEEDRGPLQSLYGEDTSTSLVATSVSSSDGTEGPLGDSPGGPSPPSGPYRLLGRGTGKGPLYLQEMEGPQGPHGGAPSGGGVRGPSSRPLRTRDSRTDEGPPHPAKRRRRAPSIFMGPPGSPGSGIAFRVQRSSSSGLRGPHRRGPPESHRRGPPESPASNRGPLAAKAKAMHPGIRGLRWQDGAW